MAFKKGQSGNPSGRPKELPEILEARKLNRAKVEEYLNKYLNMELDQLQEFIKAKKGTALEFMIATIALKGIQNGDTVRMDALLNRLIGKPVERSEAEIKLVNPYKELTHEEKLAKAKLAVALLEKPKEPDEL